MKSVPKPPPGDRPLKTIERLISKAGLGSRTEARKWVAEGRIRVNGKVVTDPDHWVDLERDKVLFDGKPLQREKRVYLLLNKPTGYLTTYSDKQGRPTVYDLLDENEKYLFPVGRLDLDTSGLLILTNDSDFAERVMNPDFKVPKTYEVKAADHLSDDQLEQLRRGVMLKDGATRPAQVRRLRQPGGKTVFEITITEGRNRQVRRMVEAIGSKVVTLTRTAIGPITAGDLELGRHRQLGEKELSALLASGVHRKTKGF